MRLVIVANVSAQKFITDNTCHEKCDALAAKF